MSRRIPGRGSFPAVRNPLQRRTDPGVLLPAAVAFVLLATLLTTGCSARRPPVSAAVRDAVDRVPVVLIPGITGTKLVDTATSRVVWGDGKRLLVPRDGGLSTALPLDPAVAPAAVATEEIRSIRLLGGLVRRDVYGPVIDWMEANGYRTGDLDDPDPRSTFYVFAYDWRRSAVDAAAILTERLEALRRARGEHVLHVHLLCQSNAAQIARYLVRFGGAPLEAAEAGTARPPPGVVVDRLLLVGTANGGAMRVLREMNRGRRYVPWVGRKLRPEVFFTYPALFEALPAYRDDRFVDPEGRPLAIDLFDPEAWRAHRWSVYAHGPLARALDPDRVATFVDRATLDRHLERSLDRARRLHAVLLGDPPGFVSPRMHLVQSRSSRTPARAIVDCRADGPCTTRFATDRCRCRRSAIDRATLEPGDGHATVDSQTALSPAETAAIGSRIFYVDDGHFEMILNPEAQRRLLEWLAP
jgi:hypothetical protein